MDVSVCDDTKECEELAILRESQRDGEGGREIEGGESQTEGEGG